MSATPAKQRTEAGLHMLEFGNWDCHHDISAHLCNKNRRLQSKSEKFNYFSVLSQRCVVDSPLGDPDAVNFLDHLYDTLKRQLLNLQEENRVVAADETDDAFVDIHYKLFLDNFRVDGKSYVLDIPRDGILVKYEPEVLEAYASLLGPPTHSPSNDTNDKTKHVSEVNVNSAGRKRKPPAKTNVALDSTAVKLGTNREGKRPVGRPKKSVANNKGLQMNEDSRVKEEEEDYNDNPPATKRLVREPVVNVDKWWHKNKVNARRPTEFREKLIDALKKPYCEKEYETLVEQLNQRKPVQCHKVLRGRLITYEEARPGKSFLDHHADLAKKIDSVRDDHPRVLNLLRGYFYWLRNLSHEGSFLPWKDPSCLEMLPQ